MTARPCTRVQPRESRSVAPRRLSRRSCHSSLAILLTACNCTPIRLARTGHQPVSLERFDGRDSGATGQQAGSRASASHVGAGGWGVDSVGACALRRRLVHPAAAPRQPLALSAPLRGPRGAGGARGRSRGRNAILVALARRGVRFSCGFVAGAFRPELLVWVGPRARRPPQPRAAYAAVARSAPFCAIDAGTPLAHLSVRVRSLDP